MAMTTEAMDRLLRITDVVRLTTMSRTTIDRWVKAGRFPAPIWLGEKSQRWHESEVLAWLDARQTSA